MIYGYIRVSSDKQTVENQRFEINNFCRRENIKIDGWMEETISGTKSYDKRQLGRLLNKVRKDDLIICAELSRLGRNLFMIMEILNICMTKECRVWTRIIIVWETIYKAKSWLLRLVYRQRLNETLSANAPKRLWHARKLKELFWDARKEGKIRLTNISCRGRKH